MTKPRLKTLKPTLRTLGLTLRPLPTRAAAARWSGRKLQDWRRRILAAEPACRDCAAKGIFTLAEEIDHIIRLEHGGTYADSNARPLCKPCHRIRTNRGG